MNLKFIHSALLLLSICFFYSCKYELEDENYIYKKEVEETGFNITLKAPITEQGVILINYEYLLYELTVFGELVENFNDYHITVYLDGKEHYNNGYYDNYAYVRLSPYSFTSGYHELKINVRCPASTGSLASDLGVEFVEKEFKWIIKADYKNTQIDINHRITNDGKMEFYWDRPDPNYGTFIRFYIYTNDYYSPFYTTETSYVFSQERYNYNIEITAYFEESFLNSWHGNANVYSNDY